MEKLIKHIISEYDPNDPETEHKRMVFYEYK